jgi:hypothetical protein
MALLHFDSYLDRWKHRLLSMCGSTDYRDHLQRSGVSYKDFTLTAAQMNTLNATPVSILAAPGAGLVNIPVGILTYVDAGATPFELGSGVLDYKYTNGSGAKAGTSVTNAAVESATDTQFLSIPEAVVPVPNAAIVAHASADVTAGDGTVYGRIWYRTVKLAEVGVVTQP